MMTTTRSLYSALVALVLGATFLAACAPASKSGPQPATSTTSASEATAKPAEPVNVPAASDAESCLKKAPVGDVTVVAPGPDVPAQYAKHVGLWSCGLWSGDLPTSLLVYSMDKDGKAKAVYAWGENNRVRRSGTVDTNARWQDDRFVTDNFNYGGVHIEFWLEGAVLKAKYVSNKGFPYYASLRKIK